MSNETKKFQEEVEEKMTKFFNIKFNQIKNDDVELFKELEEYYKDEYSFIKGKYKKKRTRYFSKEYKIKNVLLQAISEPKTRYTSDDFNNNGIDKKSIYSPRIDISFSPVIKKSKGKNESIGVYKLTERTCLFNLLYQLEFVKKIKEKIRNKSNENFRNKELDFCEASIQKYENIRPLHLFGIEIENQKNSKHLMGDFLNSLSLSKIPIVVVPEDKFDNLIKMLKFCSIISDVKKIPIYELLTTVSVLKVSQFRSILNELLENEGIPYLTDNFDKNGTSYNM